MTKTYAIIVCFLLILGRSSFDQNLNIFDNVHKYWIPYIMLSDMDVDAGLQDGAKSRELEPARNADPLSSSALGSLSPAPYHLECISEEQCYEYKCEDPHCIMHCVQATCQCSCGIKFK
ncbi:hypothetical protein FF1_008536 [Malus domestica]